MMLNRPADWSADRLTGYGLDAEQTEQAWEYWKGTLVFAPLVSQVRRGLIEIEGALFAAFHAGRHSKE